MTTSGYMRAVRETQLLAAADRASEEFLRYVFKEESGCWTWTGARTGVADYGVFQYGRITVLAHRASLILFKREPLGNLFACHHCDNPPCVNPDHLFAGTAADNAADCQKKGRRLPGADLTPPPSAAPARPRREDFPAPPPALPQLKMHGFCSECRSWTPRQEYLRYGDCSNPNSPRLTPWKDERCHLWVYRLAVTDKPSIESSTGGRAA